MTFRAHPTGSLVGTCLFAARKLKGERQNETVVGRYYKRRVLHLKENRIRSRDRRRRRASCSEKVAIEAKQPKLRAAQVREGPAHKNGRQVTAFAVGDGGSTSSTSTTRSSSRGSAPHGPVVR